MSDPKLYNPKIVKLERRHRLLSMDTSEPARWSIENTEIKNKKYDEKFIMMNFSSYLARCLEFNMVHNTIIKTKKIYF